MLDRIETQVFSRIKYGFPKEVAKDYPDLNFTTSDKVIAKAKFPCVYVHMLGSPETGENLDNIDTNMVNATFQIDVMDNEEQTRAGNVAKEVMRIMKSMRFSMAMMPYYDNTDSAYRCIMRCRRLIGSGETL